MENPATWGEAEKIIDGAYTTWWHDRESGVIGLSLAKQIGDALYEAGLLKKPDLCPECGAPQIEQWSGVKCSKCDWWFCW